MLANYEKFGFKIRAEHLPKSCTWCPFWTAPMADVEFAGCYITGSEVRLIPERLTKGECLIAR